MPKGHNDKRCTKCGDVKALEEFNRKSESKDGRAPFCRECLRAHRAKPEERAKRRAGRKQYHDDPANRRLIWANGTITNHRDHGLDVQVTRDELREHAETITHCPLCGTKINWGPKGKRGPQPDSPSWDRIHGSSTEPMTLANTRIVCFRCNAAKGAGTDTELLAWARELVKHNPQRSQS